MPKIVWAAVPLMLWSSARLDAQKIPYPRADRLTTTVRATAALLGGDTVRVSHTIRNDRSSVLRMQRFLLMTGSTFTAVVGGPTTSPYWYISTGAILDSAAIMWSANAPSIALAPGDSAVGITHKAIGELDIVRFYVQGYVAAR